MILETKDLLQEKRDEKPKFVEEMNKCLQDDIKKLFKEIEDIRKDIMQDWLVDEKSNPDEVRTTIASVAERLADALATSQDYKKIQKEFRVCG